MGCERTPSDSSPWRPEGEEGEGGGGGGRQKDKTHDKCMSEKEGEGETGREGGLRARDNILCHLPGYSTDCFRLTSFTSSTVQ